MGLRGIILIGLSMAILLQITSQVAARGLAETTTSKTNTDAVGDQANQVYDNKHGGYGGGGYGGYGRGGGGKFGGGYNGGNEGGGKFGGGFGGGPYGGGYGGGGKFGGRSGRYCPPNGC